MRGLTRSLASSPVDRREVIDPTSNRNRNKVVGSIEQLSEAAGSMFNPAFRSDSELSPSVTHRRPIQRPTYDDDGNMVEEGDYSPEMAALWDTIDKLKQKLELAPPGTRYYYKLRHYLIEKYQEQYILRDELCPKIQAKGVTAANIVSFSQTYTQPTGYWLPIEEWCARKRANPTSQLPLPFAPQRPDGTVYWQVTSNVIDYETPRHIACLLKWYTRLLMRFYEKITTEMRAILWDLESYIELAHLSDLDTFLLHHYVRNTPIHVIMPILEEQGVTLNADQVRRRQSHTIPIRIARAATRQRLLDDARNGLIPSKTCSECGRTLPDTPMFFRATKRHNYNICAKCKKEIYAYKTSVQ